MPGARFAGFIVEAEDFELPEFFELAVFAEFSDPPELPPSFAIILEADVAVC